MVARSWCCLRYMHITAARSPVFVQLLKLNVDVLCMAPSYMSAVEAAMSLVTPALCDQLKTMCNMVKKNTLLNSKVLWGFCFLELFVPVSLEPSFGYQDQWCVYTGYVKSSKSFSHLVIQLMYSFIRAQIFLKVNTCMYSLIGIMNMIHKIILAMVPLRMTSWAPEWAFHF